MRVICIDGEFRNCFGVMVTSGVPKEGDVDTVIETCSRQTNTGKKCVAYRLERFSEKTFDADQFAPLSSIDETEFERNYNKELV